MLVTNEIFGVVIILVLFFFNVPLIISSFIFIAYLLVLTTFQGLNIHLAILWIFSLAIILFFNLPFLRRPVITAKVFKTIKKKLPAISETESEVLKAGDVWWEKELFTGRPNWQKFLNFSMAKLTREEEYFLNNQVETLCNMFKDFDVVKNGDLPKEVWDYIKKERFFGLVIPKEYNGHGFSALAHSTIVMKIASRSYSVAVDIMVPNSVGLAEFILEYGTRQQKSFYLPRLACADEIPCFALTAPDAGSDAGSMPDKGIVCYRDIEGERKLGISLTFDKRYITLAPIATLIGLAFKLYDPEQLLGTTEDLGITLAILPKNTPGVEIGKRHLPMLLGFLNGPIRGRDVFIPVDNIIGGTQLSGKGWSMMMECLAVGRGLSLPALSTATAKLCYRMTSAYVKIRKQFHTSIGYFEGIKEALARVACFTYLCEATRCLTASAIDHDIKPSVATAITKYHLTELSRKIVNDAMDIHGGRAIQLGPNNYLGLFYIAQPISITVEGANILTRNLIIFGQGALRCHPYLKEEVSALNESNSKKALRKFDRLFFKHIGFVISNLIRSFFYGLTGGRWIRVPVSDTTATYYRQLTRMSVALAIVTDMSIEIMGGALKQRERLSARLGDVLSYLYLASAALKYYEDNGKPPSDLVFIRWIESFCLYQIYNAFELFFANFPNRKLARFIKFIIFPWSTRYYLPLDSQDHQIADMMMQAGSLRERLTENIYLGEEQDICRRMDLAFSMQVEANPACQKLKQAIIDGKIKDEDGYQQIMAAKDANILTEQEANQLLEFDRLRREVIQVDEFNSVTRDEKYDGQ